MERELSKREEAREELPKKASANAFSRHLMEKISCHKKTREECRKKTTLYGGKFSFLCATFPK